MFTIVNALAGSHLYGTNHENSDEDTMGIGVAKINDKLGLTPTEQNGADDHVIYELAKFVRLAVNGNPTILQLLYAPEQSWLQWDPHVWPRWQKQLRELVVTERCRASFLGYLDGQRKKILSDRQQRPELIEKYGFDVKFAAHMLRLGIQGIQIVRHGWMHLPMQGGDLALCKDVLAGKYTKQQTLDLIVELEETLKTCTSVLPSKANAANINDWMAEAYCEIWGI